MALLTTSLSDLPKHIKWLGDYHPYRLNGRLNANFDDYSSKILRLKESKPAALALFYEMLNAKLKEEVVLVCVPSSDPENIATGIRALTRKLAKENRVDGNKCLLRKIKLPKKAHGGSRNFAKEKASLQVCNPELIKGKHVILLDDVVTTGVSLNAARELLLESGAKSVNCYALGRTNWD